MISDRGVDAGSFGPSTDHAPGVRLSHLFIGEDIAVVPARRPEQPPLAVLGDPGRVDIGVQDLCERMMARHGVVLASSLVQPNGQSGAARPEVLDRHHLQGSIDAREAIGECRDQGAVAKLPERHDRNGTQQRPPFGAVENRCFAGLYDVRWPAHRYRGVGRDHLTGHHPVEQHPYGGELLLDRRCRDLVLPLLYMGRNVMGPDRGERKASILTPRQKPITRSEISPARIGITDIGSKEFDIAPGGLITQVGDDRRYDVERPQVGGNFGLLDGGRKLGAGRFQRGLPALGDMRPQGQKVNTLGAREP